MTQHIELNTQWQEIAAAPCLVEVANENGSVLLHFAATAPAADSKARHKLNRLRGLSFGYAGAQKTWARANIGTEHIVVT